MITHCISHSANFTLDLTFLQIKLNLAPTVEWLPSYNVMNSCLTKAQAIRLMMDAVTKELGLTINQIAPVNLKQGFEYNVEEGLIPSIFQQLEQAKQVHYLRCLNLYLAHFHEFRLLDGNNLLN